MKIELLDITSQLESMLDDSAALAAPDVARHIAAVLRLLADAAGRRSVAIKCRIDGDIALELVAEQSADAKFAKARRLMGVTE